MNEARKLNADVIRILWPMRHDPIARKAIRRAIKYLGGAHVS